MNEFPIEPGMKVVIRDDIRNWESGISNAESYAGMEMTVTDVMVDYEAFTLAEDTNGWWWNLSLIKSYRYSDGMEVDDASIACLVSSY